MNEPLSRYEAQLVADWINDDEDQGVTWTDVWRLSPTEIAKRFKVTMKEVVAAARRQSEEEE